LIHLYKYGRIKTLARPLGALLRSALPDGERFDAATPVPLHWRRRWERGFNQSELLARAVARRCGIPVVHALRRVRATPAQAGLSNTARRRNVAAAFRPRRTAPWSRPVAGARILLIDDVMTTGSTAAACAIALKGAGAARVALLTVARVDRRIDGAPLAAYSTSGGSF
jgi:ComF family protein